MRHLFFIVSVFITFFLKAQNAESIIAGLKNINQKISNKSCIDKNASAISNRAMNIFLADKTGYLSESGDLSYYTNYVTLNTLKGELTINHHFQKASGNDDRIKKLFSVGLNMNIANGFTRSFSDEKIENEFGVTLNYKWLGKVKTRFSNCEQKQSMDALRIGIMHEMGIEIDKKEADFKLAIEAIDLSEIPGQNIDAARELIKKNFYDHLAEEYAEKFAKLQAESLTDTRNFRLVSTHWTSINTYIPLAFPKYSIAQSLYSSIQSKRPYPLSLTLSHTRFWENSKIGRLFFTVSSNFLFNNSKLSYELTRFSAEKYIRQGGVDTLHLGKDNIFLGDYLTCVTPSIKGRLFYFPPESHVGMSFSMEKYFGIYNVLNGKLGIPIVLINSKKLPAANFEIDVLFFDMTNEIEQGKKSSNKVFVGLEVGIPFSRLMY